MDHCITLDVLSVMIESVEFVSRNFRYFNFIKINVSTMWNFDFRDDISIRIYNSYGVDIDIKVCCQNSVLIELCCPYSVQICKCSSIACCPSCDVVSGIRCCRYVCLYGNRRVFAVISIGICTCDHFCCRSGYSTVVTCYKSNSYLVFIRYVIRVIRIFRIGSNLIQCVVYVYNVCICIGCNCLSFTIYSVKNVVLSIVGYGCGICIRNLCSKGCIVVYNCLIFGFCTIIEVMYFIMKVCSSFEVSRIGCCYIQSVHFCRCKVSVCTDNVSFCIGPVHKPVTIGCCCCRSSCIACCRCKGFVYRIYGSAFCCCVIDYNIAILREVCREDCVLVKFCSAD